MQLSVLAVAISRGAPMQPGRNFTGLEGIFSGLLFETLKKLLFFVPCDLTAEPFPRGRKLVSVAGASHKASAFPILLRFQGLPGV